MQSPEEDCAAVQKKPPDPSERLALYRWAVQDPETHAEVLRIMYEWYSPGRTPVTFREDFAGTAADSVAWVAIRPGRRAYAVEIDGPTAAWAERRAQRILGNRASDIRFVVDAVFQVGPDRSASADILAVLNFSIFFLRDPDTLGAYLSHAFRCLAPHGILVLNLFGGREALTPRIERDVVVPTPRLSTEPGAPSFDYVWEQVAWDPGSRRMDCRIHFEVEVGVKIGTRREIRDAFVYDWRVWTPAELMQAMQKAGFAPVEVWRHTFDPTQGLAGLFLGPVPPSELDDVDNWTAYIVGVRL